MGDQITRQTLYRQLTEVLILDDSLFAASAADDLIIHETHRRDAAVRL